MPQTAQVDNQPREEVLVNEIRTLSSRIQRLLDPRRDVYEECGYPGIGELTITHYKDMYDREPIAARVVQVLPQESWMISPEIYETANSTSETPFEMGIRDLNKSLKGKSWHNDEEGALIWNYLERLDELSGIGSFGVMLLGIDDGLELSEPYDETPGPQATRNLKYLRVFDESQVSIESWDDDPESDRFGYPLFYNISFTDESTKLAQSSKKSTTTHKVHWSRVIHVADNLGSSESFGIPRQKQVYNRLYDLVKLYSANPEMYWKGAFPGLSVESHPQLGGDVDFDKKAIAEEIHKMMNTLQRVAMTTGATVKSIAPQVVDPTPQIKVTLEAICIKIGIPVRIFMGSERGELASSQDDSSWNDRLAYRQNRHLTPHVVCQFFDRLIDMNVLPEPAEGYKVKWPDLNSLDDETKANVLQKRVQALVQFYQSDVFQVFDLEEFLIREFGYEADDAKVIMQKAEKTVQDILTEEQAQNDYLSQGAGNDQQNARPNPGRDPAVV